MAQGYKINGLKELQAKLKKLPDQVKQAAIADIEDAADMIVIKAVQKVPVDLGVLKQSIGNEPKNGGLNYIVFVGAEYAPYVEFGTGTEVEVPTELTNYAKQFKGNNQGQVNLSARPFFFPGYFEERKKLLKTLEQSIAQYL